MFEKWPRTLHFLAASFSTLGLPLTRLSSYGDFAKERAAHIIIAS